MKKVAITGHTNGIGKSLCKYFVNNNYSVCGFSKSSGYDISQSKVRQDIVQKSEDCEIFINNAFNNWDDSQLRLLELINQRWQGQNKLIFNISSRYTHDDNVYCKLKMDQDRYCEQYLYQRTPHIVNIKPGLIDTDRVKHINQGTKLSSDTVIDIVDFVLSTQTKYRISTIIFGF